MMISIILVPLNLICKTSICLDRTVSLPNQFSYFCHEWFRVNEHGRQRSGIAHLSWTSPCLWRLQHQPCIYAYCIQDKHYRRWGLWIALPERGRCRVGSLRITKGSVSTVSILSELHKNKWIHTTLVGRRLSNRPKLRQGSPAQMDGKLSEVGLLEFCYVEMFAVTNFKISSHQHTILRLFLVVIFILRR
jgi:hypothetical protein